MNLKTTTVVKKIILSKRIADYIFGREECAFVGQESELSSAEPEALCCDGGATSSLSSSFLNCTDITERAVPIHTAQGGTVMTTITMLSVSRRIMLDTSQPRHTLSRISSMIYYQEKCSTKQDILKQNIGMILYMRSLQRL